VMGGTGLIEAGTFLAILGGQLLADILLPRDAALAALDLAVVGLSSVSRFLSRHRLLPGKRSN
jgi:acyl-[acyl-carrier-protein]-phospholipid O-acyltransferase/long-chain-fatty-acid--[acyl-carrier-protein] ligase